MDHSIEGTTELTAAQLLPHGLVFEPNEDDATSGLFSLSPTADEMQKGLWAYINRNLDTLCFVHICAANGRLIIQAESE